MMFVFASRGTIMLVIVPLQKNALAMTTMDSKDDH